MEKLKNMISPGHQDDDQKLYGTEGSSGTHPSATTAAQQVAHQHPGGVTSQTGTHPSTTGGNTNMPGGFDTPREESTRPLGNQPSTTSSANPASGYGSTSGGLGNTAGTTSGEHYDSRAPQIPAQDFGPSATTHHPTGSHPSSGLTGSNTAGTGAGYPSSGATGPIGTATSSTRDPYASNTGGIGSTSDSGRLQDPSFSNRTLHQSSPTGPSSSPGHHGRDALAGAGVSAAGYEAVRHHGNEPTSTSGTHGLGSSTHPTSTTSGTHGFGSATHPTSSTSGHHGLGSTTHPTTGTGGTTGSTHPTTGSSSSNPASGVTGTSSSLPHRSTPRADIGGTTTDRSFPLGGHAGEGPHPTTTANRLDPHVPDTADEFRRGTHHHGAGVGTTGTGLGAGALAGEEAARHGGLHSGSTRTSEPTSGITGSSGTSSILPHSSSTTDPSHTTGHGSHLGRDTAAGVGGAGLGAGAAHELGRDHDTSRGIGSTGASTGSGSTMVSGSGASNQPSSGLRYNTLADGTPSGISTRDPAHPSSSTSGPTSGATTGSHTSHLGRDAALGGGAAALGGTAAHEAGRHHHGTDGTGPTTSSATNQPRTSVPGGQTRSGDKYDHLADGTPSGIATSQPQHSSHIPGSTSTRDPSSTTGSGHHYGRDAGVGAAGVGAGGLAAHEYEKHRGQPSSNVSSYPTGSSQHAPVPGYNPPTAVPGQTSSSHPTGTAASGTQQSFSNYPEQHHGSHTGRDTAAVAGVGGVGTAAAYEADKHKHTKDSPTSDSQHRRDTTEEPKPGLVDKLLGRDPQEKEAKKLEKEHEKEQKAHDKEIKKLESKNEKEEKEHEKELKKLEKEHEKDAKSHKGEAALAGAGAGGAGVAGYEAAKHHGSTSHPTTDQGPIPGTGTHGQQPFQSPASGQAYAPSDGRLPTTGPTAAGGSPLPTGGPSGYDGTQAAAQRHGYAGDTSHTGRDAALSTAGAGGAAYGADKFAHPSHSTAPTSGTSTQPGYGSTERTPVSGHRDTSGTHHTGRDAALGTAGAGGAAYGAEKLAHPSSGNTSSGVPSSTTGPQRYGGTDDTPLPTRGNAAGIDPRVDTPQYGSGHTGSAPVSATDSGYAGSPTTTTKHGASDSPSSGEKPGLLQRLLHRDDPNKLDKQQGTSHHGETGTGHGGSSGV